MSNAVKFTIRWPWNYTKACKLIIGRIPIVCDVSTLRHVLESYASSFTLYHGPILSNSGCADMKCPDGRAAMVLCVCVCGGGGGVLLIFLGRLITHPHEGPQGRILNDMVCEMRQKLQNKFATSPSHRSRTLGQPAPEPTLYRQASGRIATRVPSK